MNVYDFTVKTGQGEDLSLSTYRGRVLLIVNTATGCGFTPQYKALEEMYEAYRDRGFEILDFPCNQFAGQAPGSNEEIYEFCTGRFGMTFPQFSKIEVNGPNADPLYEWLTSNTSFDGFDGAMKLMLTPVVRSMDKDYKNNGNIKWNFTKFLIDRDGNILERFEPTYDMKKLREKIEATL